jgi:hypothetical protein
VALQRQLERNKNEYARERDELRAEVKTLRADLRSSERQRAVREAEVLKLQRDIQRLRSRQPAGARRKSAISPATHPKKKVTPIA